MTYAKDFKLTKSNYYSPDRPHLSYSQMKTYLKSPRLYKLRYIEKTNKLKMSDPIKFGKLVDAALTDEKVFTKFSISEGKRGLTEEEKEWIVSETLFQNALTLSNHIFEQPFWKVRKAFQVVLQGELNGQKVSGLADAILKTPVGDWILDIKTTSEMKMKNEKSWFYHSIGLGYHIQAGLYRELVLQQTGKLVDFVHLVCCVDSDGMPQAKLYRIPDELCAQGLALASIALDGIVAGNFEQEKLTWDSVKDLQINTPYDNDLQEVFE